MKTEERSRHTVWMEDAVWQKVQEQYKQDGCSTQNEFIAKAIMFYCGYLQSDYAGDFLPKILGETLEAILSMFGDRIGKQLLKQAVEQNICNHIIASDMDIDAATYQKMRGMSYQEVLRTNGQTHSWRFCVSKIEFEVARKNGLQVKTALKRFYLRD